jgi:predicted signal transduction protein with EAL and GGDEF domain
VGPDYSVYCPFFQSPGLWVIYWASSIATQPGNWLSKRTIIAISIVPVIGILIVLTIDAHQFFYIHFEIVERNIKRNSTHTKATSVPITISIGVAILDFNNDTTIDKLIDRADFALYHAKQSGRNRVGLYDNIDRESNLTNKETKP